ncbi:unnamed protein product [Plutella xylostella]|uniref:(diamondback moth) hypothetical protein n=1 Tax=Plutella xylostella TaxID=51655 RepID=A0A8S4DYD2_PLUXY|nr:unnamed protein product [Plutella xylostella]
MLRLKGQEIPEQTDHDPEFLMEIMEINEAVESAETEADIMKLNKENKSVIESLQTQLSSAFSDGDMKQVTKLLARLKYYTSIENQIQGAIRSKGQASSSTRLLGGAPTTIERCPIVAQLLRERVQYCAAVVLTARHVLSAAHCILADPTYNNPKLWKIRVGSSYRTRGGVLHDVKTIITHPGFDKRIYNNDVAVLVASKPFTLNKYVRQGTIPKPGTETKENSKVTLIGWGVTTNDPNSMQPDQMRYATLRTIDHATCQKRYSNLSATITEAMMCGGLLDQGGVDGCYGDSGGPLIYKGVVVGLMSFGYSCGHPYYPGVSIVKSVGFFAVGVVVASECAGLEIMPSTPQ